MRYIVFALTILGLFVQESLTTQAAFYSCKNNHVLLSVEVSAGEILYDVYAESFPLTCGALGAPAVVSTTLGPPDVYVVDLDLSAGYTGSNDLVCGATGALATDAVVSFVTQGLSNMFESTDLRYTVTCDFTQPNFEFVALDLSAVSSITGKPTDTLPTLITEAVIMELLDAVPTPITAAVLADQVSLRATLTPSATAFGMRITECVAQRTAGDTTVQVTLIDNLGCVVGTAGPLEDTGSEFTGDGTNGVVATTPTFGMFKFTDADTLYIQCKVWFCPAASDVTCSASHCGADPTGRRKRRQAQSQNVTYTGLTIRVVDSIDKLKEELNGEAGNNSCDNEAKTYTLTFGAIIGILSFLLLLGLMLVVFLFLRIRRREEIDEKIHHHPVVMTVKQ